MDGFDCSMKIREHIDSILKLLEEPNTMTDRHRDYVKGDIFNLLRNFDTSNEIARLINLGLDNEKANNFFENVTESPSKIPISWDHYTLAYGKYFNKENVADFIDFTDNEKDGNELFIGEDDEEMEVYCKLKEKCASKGMICYVLPCCFTASDSDFCKYDIFIGFLIRSFSWDEKKQTSLDRDYTNLLYNEMSNRKLDWEQNIVLKSYPLLNNLWAPILEKKYSDKIKETKEILGEDCEFCMIPSGCLSCT